MIFLFVVSAGLFLEIFDWRSSSKRIGLILHVSYYMFCEVFGGLSIWILYTAFWESNDESDIFRTSGEIIGIIISVFNSIQCTYFNTKIIIYYMFNGVSKLTIIPCTIPDMRLQIQFIVFELYIHFYVQFSLHLSNKLLVFLIFCVCLICRTISFISA